MEVDSHTAPGEDAALEALQVFSEGQWGVKYPTTVAARDRAWEKFTPFLAFPPQNCVASSTPEGSPTATPLHGT